MAAGPTAHDLDAWVTAHDLDAWVLETAPRATAYAKSLLGNEHEAEDIVQDCYCRLIAKAGTYDLKRDGQKLLFTAIGNACINLRTRRKPTYSLTRSDADGGGRTEDPADPKAVAPDDSAAAGELQSAMAQGLRLLPTQQRAAVELKAFGYSQQEIAEMLGITTSNAGVLVHRARQTLAQYLAPYLAEEPNP